MPWENYTNLKGQSVSINIGTQGIDDEEDFDNAYEIVSKFLNALAFEHGTGYEITSVSSMGLKDRVPLPRAKPFSTSPRNFSSMVSVISLRPPETKEAHFALSIYSEAMHSKSPFQAFLCYWRILEIRYDGRPVHSAGDWINMAIREKYNIYLSDEIKEMISKGEDVGRYFAEQCRNAIAHVQHKRQMRAYRWPDRYRIYRAVYALKSFVDYFIRKTLRMPKYRERVEIIRVVNPSGSRMDLDYSKGVRREIELPKDISTRLRAAREGKALTRKEVALYAGVSESMVARVERGSQPRDVTTIPRIAKVVGVRLSELSHH